MWCLQWRSYQHTCQLLQFVPCRSFENSLATSRPMVTWALNCAFQNLELENGKEVVRSFGMLKHSRMQTGWRTKPTEGRQAALCTSSTTTLPNASSRTQRVVSLSSAESELHSMVSGCSDAIFLRRCMEFLTGDEIEQWQWVDNSAARQLIERQGVGRVRHLSGKILWMQSLVLEKQIKLGQVPTQWNVSDVGTKPLAKQRLLVLLHEIGCCNPDTHEMVGQEEYEAFEERTVGKQMVKRIAKTIMRMAVLWGLEPNLQGAEATAVDEEVCQQVQASGNNGGNTWLWFSVFLLFMLWVGLAVAGYVAWKKFAKTTTDLESCWNQVADEDSYIAKQVGEDWPSDSTPWSNQRAQWTGSCDHFRSNYRMQQWVEHGAWLCIGTSLQHCRTWRFLAKWMWSYSRAMAPPSNSWKSKSG